MVTMAGKLRHRITIQRATETLGTSGDITRTWAEYATVWADVRAAKSDEKFSGQTQSRIDYVIEIRSGITPTSKDRILHDGNTLEISNVYDPDQRGTRLMLECTEVVDHG